MNSKYKIKGWLFTIAIACLALLISSCDKKDDVDKPTIDYIRYITPADTASYANLGESVAIIGKNLETVKEITFNGYPGIFKTTMVTNTSIVVYISKNTPFMGSEATSKTVVYTDGGEASANLEIAPPAPNIESTSPQYAGEGGIVNIKGSFFYNISSVTFGDSTATIIDYDPYSITVKVPQGYKKGPIHVNSSKSGEGVSAFDFGLEPEVIQLNWGDISPSNGAWWNSSADGPVDAFEALGTPYKYVEGTFGNTWWTLDGGINFDNNDQRKGNPIAKALKFEYALVGDAPWIQILWKSSLGEYKFIVKDLVPSNGKWATYAIPMNTFTLGDDGNDMTQEVFESDNPLLVQYAFVNSGEGEITINCAMTNFRFEDK